MFHAHHLFIWDAKLQIKYVVIKAKSKDSPFLNPSTSIVYCMMSDLFSVRDGHSFGNEGLACFLICASPQVKVLSWSSPSYIQRMNDQTSKSPVRKEHLICVVVGSDGGPTTPRGYLYSCNPNSTEADSTVG